MRLIVLGAGAGGGLPQWNCGCRNCEGARSGRIAPMTQSSIAVSADGATWAVINASPDIRAQIAATPALHPKTLRGSSIAAVLLTNGDLDHVAGLLTLREGQPFRLLATAAIHDVLAGNPMLNALDPSIVLREVIAVETPFDLLPGLTARLMPVPGKVPLYLEAGQVVTDAMGEETVAVELTSGGKRAVYAPACAAMPPMLRARLAGADLLLLDGTVWTDDEMPRAGLSTKTGRRMGHMAVSGADGSMAALDGTEIGDKILIHINNSNPLVDPDSSARATAAAAGWRVAHDGMEVTC
ncbi:pyrroloquinoline quinone biosynthesis protein PqqB [Paracoccus suum]|uniref:Coenzyme PQQ synthesis protein B n=1 Tax=Paracoccus suum TaxID=2259340 RepID=A0A344PLR0_9RHOB|nr:pyrroloquinoline quinone biosynthesis protein PqqB [Paracoccus suum]AXC50315.1 pyrroloquinoline quinone biosynthesis protein PqqB [Paracoccus suum]